MYGVEKSRRTEQFENSSNDKNQLLDIIEVYFSNYKPLTRKFSNQKFAIVVLKWDIIATFKCIIAAFNYFRSQLSNSINACNHEANMLLDIKSFINEIERNTLKIFKNLALDPSHAILYICERIIELENEASNEFCDKKMKLLISLVNTIDDIYGEISQNFLFEYNIIKSSMDSLNDKRNKVQE